MKKLLVAVWSVGAAASAYAALNASLVSAIDSMKADLLALLVLFTTAGAAVWVGRLIYRHFMVKANAILRDGRSVR